MKIVKFTVLILIVAALAAFVTKPSDEECKKEAKGEVDKYIQARYERSGMPKFAIPTTVKSMIRHSDEEDWIRVEDKGLWKTVTYVFNGERRRNIGYGAFNTVKIAIEN